MQAALATVHQYRRRRNRQDVVCKKGRTAGMANKGASARAFSKSQQQQLKGAFYEKSSCGDLFGAAAVLQCMVVRPDFYLLHSFDGTDGAQSHAGLIQGTDGNLYGTTAYGGSDNDGTVFKIPLGGGSLTRLATFHGTNGMLPLAGLVQEDGNLYGTTYFGGVNGDGTVFKIFPTGGTLTTVYSFCSQSGCSDGGGPAAGLIQATDGKLCGTTYNGGVNGDGTVFSLSLGNAQEQRDLSVDEVTP